MPDSKNLIKINALMSQQTLPQRLATIAELTERPVFTTSLGREDQVLLWHIVDSKSKIAIATLNTGRLFDETLSLLDETQEKLGVEIEILRPDPEAVKQYVAGFGENGFYDSLDARKQCCHIRKVAPLSARLKNADGWVTGLNREQSPGRSAMPFAEWDDAHQLIKFNPIADFSDGFIRQQVETHAIPVSSLHERGYPSIGCAPCTRAIKPGEHPRAGRWWWENNQSTECGLHTTKIPA